MQDVVAIGIRAPRLDSFNLSLRMRVLYYLTMGAQLTMLVDPRLQVLLICGQG